MSHPIINRDDLAAALSVSARSVRRRAAAENWPHELSACRGGREKVYRLDRLPADVQSAVYRHLKESASATLPAVVDRSPFPARRPATPPRQLPDPDAGALAKADLLRLYEAALRSAPQGRKGRAREEFIRAYNTGLAWPVIFGKIGSVSWKTLEQWKRAVREAGGDCAALVDTRGKWRQGDLLIGPEQAAVVLACALRPNAPLIAEVVREAKAVMSARGIHNGFHETTYRRWLKKWAEENYDVWVWAREGAKAFNDKVARYIDRDYSRLNVGDVLVADGHVLNFEVINPWTGKPKRMTLIGWKDMKSNFVCGWEIMPTENTAAIGAALRRAILTLGKAPRVAYLDNGKAFRSRFFAGCQDFAEAGFTGLFERLEIKPLFAWPYHGQSKTIERFFGTFAELERRMISYTGTSIEKKPPRMRRGERLHRKLHEKLTGGETMTLEQAHRAVAAWLDEYHQRPQRGHLDGLCPAEVFGPGRGEGVDPVALRHLMLACEIKQIRNGRIYLLGVEYTDPALFGRSHAVTVRYDLADRSSILVEHDGEILCEAYQTKKIHPVASILGDAADREELSAEIAQKKREEKAASITTRAMLEADVIPAHQRMMARIAGDAGATDGHGRPRTATDGRPNLRRLPAPAPVDEATQAAIEAEVIEIERESAAMAAAEARGRLERMNELDRYEALLEMQAKGELIPADWQAFMSYFEKTPAYQVSADYYEERRAVFATMWQAAK